MMDLPLNHFKILSFSNSAAGGYIFGIPAISNIIPFMYWLCNSTTWQADTFTDATVIDLHGTDIESNGFCTFPRFVVVYMVMSFTYNCRVTILTTLQDYSTFGSLTSLFEGINWSEREMFEMFGIKITGHPDLRRLLSDYGFVGFPLRKDFPMSGFRELFYREDVKRVCYSELEFPQEFRSFRFITQDTK